MHQRLTQKTDTIKLLQENIEKKLLNIGLGNHFLDIMQRAQTTKAKLNKWDYFKLNGFCTAKETPNTMKRQYKNGKKCCKPYIR